MITRIKIKGFKTLLDTELYLGIFTCIAGANAVGKSNFLDALMFLSHLADHPIVQAVNGIRSEKEKHSDIRDIFFRSGKVYLSEMSFEMDIIIPKEGVDDLGQNSKATCTSLRYQLRLQLNPVQNGEPIQILSESLRPIPRLKTQKQLYFAHSSEWLASLLYGQRSTPFISTLEDKIRLHPDGVKGNATDFIAQNMPRTLLSTVTAASPTAFLVRQEMRRWMLLQFDPSALRQPNSIYEVYHAEITAKGLNLPATLYRLQHAKPQQDVYQQLTNRLKGLVEHVHEIQVDRDDKRNLLTLQMVFKDGLTLPAPSLSDGTLRFLGLAVLGLESEKHSLICLEEPENGMNPQKMSEMLDLLQEMATDTALPVDADNPLKQVIINTHSPLVVRAVPDESLYLAKKKEIYLEACSKKVQQTTFVALEDTWKTKKGLLDKISWGEMLAYLDTTVDPFDINAHKRQRTVAQNLFPYLNPLPL